LPSPLDKKESIMPTAANQRAQWLRYVLVSSFLGILIVSSLAIVQSQVVFRQPLIWRGYIIPIIVGCILGFGIGSIIVVLKRREQEQDATLRVLRQNEEMLQLITNNINALVAYVGADERYKFVNATYAAWFSRPREQIIGHTIRELVGDAVYQRGWQRQKVLGGERVIFEENYSYPDGVVRDVWGFYDPHISADKQVLGYFVYVVDVSELKQKRAALQQSETLRRALLEAIPDVIARINRDGVYLEIKAPANFNSILPVAQMLGKKQSKVLPAAMAQQFQENIAYALATNKLHTFEYTAVINHERRYREARIVPINGDEVLAILRDITERKQVEESLHQKEAHHRSVVEAIPDAIVRMRRDGVYLEAQPPKEFAAPTDSPEVIGQKVQDVLPQAADAILRAIDQALTTNKTQRLETTIVIEGQVRERELRVAPSSADEVIIIVRDITKEWGDQSDR
jgi:PAS domain S-box-containing protein